MHQTRDMPVAPGGEKSKLALQREGNDVLVEPWPFSVERVELMVPAMHVPGKRFASEKEFRDVYKQAPAEIFSSIVRPAGL
jgi:hypothetical protein